MTKKAGRPRKTVKNERVISFWVTKMQDFVIKEKAAKAGVIISDYMRQMAVTGQVKAKWTAEERQMVRQLIAMAGDIHQLVVQAQKEGALNAALLFGKYRGIFDEIINTLCHGR